MPQLELSAEIVNIPVPNMNAQRTLRKEGYQDWPLDTEHPLAMDPIVGLSDYGIESRAYYSKPNVTGDAIEGVRPDVVIRRDIAERLARVNEFLGQADFLAQTFGERPALYVAEGLRSVALQGQVHDEIYPAFLRKTHPDWTEEMIAEERTRRVAKPSPSSPHASGGAVDVRLVLADDPTTAIPFGYDHEKKLTIQPDHLERVPADTMARITRRVLYHTMVAAGFVNNPEEVWHFGRGDRLSSKLAGVDAYYAMVEGAPDRN